jgi:two-component system, NarL family, sensor kinase
VQSAKGTVLFASRRKRSAHINGKDELPYIADPALPELFWNCARDGLFGISAIANGEFVFGDVNPAYRQLLGAHDVDFIGKTPAGCLPSDLAVSLLAQCRGCVETGEPVEYDDIRDTFDGPRCRRTTLTPVKDPVTGTVLTILGRLQDLAADGGTAKPDESSRRLLKRIVDTSPDVIYVFDLTTGRNAFLSSRVRQALGYSREFLQSLDTGALLDLIHPDDLPTVKQHMLRVRALTDGAIATVEYRCRLGNGSYRWFRGKETVFSRTTDGCVEKVVGILSDIDRLKKARIEFTRMNARLAAILASISDCYLTIDHECRVTNVNAAAAKWLGKERDAVVGKNYRGIVDGSAAQAVVREAIRDRRKIHAEMPSQLHAGRWIDLRVYPAEEGVNIFFSDITKRKRAEQAAARSQALLSASIDSLSAQIVILDSEGAIVASNKAWRRFATSQWPKDLATGPRSNLLELYDRARGRSADLSQIGAGIKALLAGRRTMMRHIYHSGLGVTGSWYQLIAARFIYQSEPFAVIVTEDVTAVREAKKAIGELSQRMLTLQEDERQRIAAELHDSTAQHLAAIGLNAIRLRTRSACDAETCNLWEDVEASLEEAARELRAFTYLLHPMRLENDGLNAALRRYVKGFTSRTGIKVMLKLSREIDELPVPLRHPMLRIVQEALANVHRHAGASRVSVKQKLIKDQLHLIISDNGSGIRKLSKNGRSEGFAFGVGIPAMRERLRQIGGKLEIQSGPRGTRVEVRVPLERSLTT